ncbi:MAG TPA: RHS repeat-associated core domain-containing protein [Thermoanaerobaculia bacterium]|nr:RHS repeat-associated core domain-containing protein [Thermoanaerobaculia bacterium]
MTGTYTYDAFGNRKTATGETNCSGQTVCASPLTVSLTTNHLLTTTANSSTTNVGYDAAGNITSVSGGSYAYDGTGMMTEATVGSDDRQFVYTADDERIVVRQGQSWTWTVRGLDNKVLREFTSTEPNNAAGFPAAGGTWIKDYVWRDGLLLASTDTTGTYHYHLDHLGTPRLITNASGVKVAEHAYYPFGAEISLTPHESNEEAMKFTGHERDIVAGDGHTLDDMHARYYNASLGRFLEVDPVLGKLDQPQSWNRYSYTENNPVNLLDPDGRATALGFYGASDLDQVWMSFGSAVAATAAAPAQKGRLAAAANAINRTADWAQGEGPEQMVFGQGSVEVAQMQHAPGVNKARSAFHNKNATNIAKHRPLQPLLNYKGKFGLREFVDATLEANATEHFVGSYTIVELTRFRGHLKIGESHDAKTTQDVSRRVQEEVDCNGARRAYAGRAKPTVRAVGAVDPELGCAGRA